MTPRSVLFLVIAMGFPAFIASAQVVNEPVPVPNNSLNSVRYSFEEEPDFFNFSIHGGNIETPDSFTFDVPHGAWFLNVSISLDTDTDVAQYFSGQLVFRPHSDSIQIKVIARHDLALHTPDDGDNPGTYQSTWDYSLPDSVPGRNSSEIIDHGTHFDRYNSLATISKREKENLGIDVTGWTYILSGRHLETRPVSPGGIPEPSTYGAMAAVILAFLVVRRRFRSAAAGPA